MRLVHSLYKLSTLGWSVMLNRLRKTRFVPVLFLLTKLIKWKTTFQVRREFQAPVVHRADISPCDRVIRPFLPQARKNGSVWLTGSRVNNSSGSGLGPILRNTIWNSLPCRVPLRSRPSRQGGGKGAGDFRTFRKTSHASIRLETNRAMSYLWDTAYRRSAHPRFNSSSRPRNQDCQGERGALNWSLSLAQSAGAL